MEIWLVRHGETDWNVEGRVQGWTDVPLNDVGKRQADRLAAWLRPVHIDHIYSSDLERALETARRVSRTTGAPITVRPCLREHYFGQAEGLLRSESLRRFPNGAPDREPPERATERVVRCLKEIARAHPHGRVLIATHGGVVRSILRWMGVDFGSIDNTSITRISVIEDTFHALGVNETPHLADVSALRQSNG
ncbi:histidine phosphatase family protein [Alicyclobacillus sendaiensis]|uniref:histidine phosphatase family protein n=1 Tax=Alicyclobacillus sendaiensis TaxID=192387 RepID=UPI0026F473FE|nr:histidine phosphatase family protein [Alicyclobacillus sendaiensis]